MGGDFNAASPAVPSSSGRAMNLDCGPSPASNNPMSPFGQNGRIRKELVLRAARRGGSNLFALANVTSQATINPTSSSGFQSIQPTRTVQAIHTVQAVPPNLAGVPQTLTQPNHTQSEQFATPRTVQVSRPRANPEESGPESANSTPMTANYAPQSVDVGPSPGLGSVDLKQEMHRKRKISQEAWEQAQERSRARRQLF